MWSLSLPDCVDLPGAGIGPAVRVGAKDVLLESTVLGVATVYTLVLVSTTTLATVALAAGTVSTEWVEGTAAARERAGPAINVVDWVTEVCCNMIWETFSIIYKTYCFSKGALEACGDIHLTYE